MRQNILLTLTFVLIYSLAFANPISIHQEDFEDCNNISWTNIAASNDGDATDLWTCDNSDGVIIANGFGGGNDEDWLVSPAFNLDNQEEEFFIFNYLNGFSGPDIELYYSTNFSGLYNTTDLEAATWNLIPLNLYDISGDAYISQALPHHAIDISNIVGTAVYFAFKYSATGNSGSSETWELDNIKILADYYNEIDFTQNCTTLKTALYQLINDHFVIPYSATSDFDVWNSQFTTDRRLNDDGSDFIVFDRYSDVPDGPEPYEFTLGADQDDGSLPTMEGVFYNREHVFPRSWWGGSSINFVDTQFTDIHTIIPSDKFVNFSRSNYPIGAVATPTYTTMNGATIGTSGATGYSGTLFEPIDEYKGDLARIFLYMAVRYENQIAGWETFSSIGDDALDGSSYTVYEPWFLDQLMAWHIVDPVSPLEEARNNAIYAIQGNRNPFVDLPDLADDLWGAVCFALPVELRNFNAQKTQNGVELNWSTESEINNDYFQLEHSLDGFNFESIAIIKGKQYSNQLTSYNYFHDTPKNGNNYYRLQQIDLDGEITSISTQVIDIKSNSEISFYPNPVNDQLIINQSYDIPILVCVKNILGHVLAEFIITETQQVINLSDLTNGVYLLEIKVNNELIKSDRIFKLKE